MEIIIIIFSLVLLPIIWLIGTYNGLVRLENHCRESWSGIETELKRRHDLIPNLVETVKGYAAHEQGVLESLTQARAAATNQHGTTAAGREESELVRAVKNLIAVSEAYPQLRADQHFLALQRELVNTEDRIQASRRFFNANVRDFNNRVEMFPSSMVAGMASFKRREHFEVEPLSLTLPEVRIAGN